MSNLRWEGSPQDLKRSIAKFGANSVNRMNKIGDFWGPKLAELARQNAPWTDRTGDARTGLFGFNEKVPGRMRITVSHGEKVFYGVYLELKNNGRYAIIWPTITQNVDKVMQSFKAVFK